MVRATVVESLSLRIEDRDQVRDVVGNQPEHLLALAELYVRHFLLQSEPDRGANPAHVFLEHIVGGASPHAVDGRLFVNGAGHADHGRSRSLLARQKQRLHAVETRQRIVRENDVRREFSQRGEERLAVVDAATDKSHSLPVQLALEHLSVRWRVFQNQNAHLGAHYWCIYFTHRINESK